MRPRHGRNCRHTLGWFAMDVRLFIQPAGKQDGPVPEGRLPVAITGWPSKAEDAERAGMKWQPGKGPIIAVCNAGCGAVRTFKFSEYTTIKAGRVKRSK